MLSERRPALRKKATYQLGMLAARTAHAMLLAEPSQLEIAHGSTGLRHGRRYLSPTEAARARKFIRSGSVRKRVPTTQAMLHERSAQRSPNRNCRHVRV